MWNFVLWDLDDLDLLFGWVAWIIMVDDLGWFAHLIVLFVLCCSHDVL